MFLRYVFISIKEVIDFQSNTFKALTGRDLMQARKISDVEARGAVMAAVHWLPLQVCRFINFQHDELGSEALGLYQTKTKGAVISFSAS